MVQAWRHGQQGRGRGPSVPGLVPGLVPGELCQAGGSSSGCASPPTWPRLAWSSALTTAPRPALAPQASAIAPFGVFGDLRWVSVYHDSWPTLAGELVAMLLVRGALTAVSVALAWPSHLPAPPIWKLLPRGVFATAFGAVLLAPSVVLLFGLAAAPVSWLFFAAVPSALLVAFIAHPIGVTSEWWRRLIADSCRRLGGAVLCGAERGHRGRWRWPPRPCGRSSARCAGCSMRGRGGGWSVWSSTVGRLAIWCLPYLWLPWPSSPSWSAGRWSGSATCGRRKRTPVRCSTEPAGNGQPVLVVSGYGSTWDGNSRHPVPGNFMEVPFSYRGLDAAGAPLPYTAMDTVKALPVLDRMLLTQVTSLYTRTGRPVDVVAESEGALVAKTALLTQAASPGSDAGDGQPDRRPGTVFLPDPGRRGVGGGDGRSHAASERCFPGGGTGRPVAG